MRRLKVPDLHSFNTEKALAWIVSAMAFLFPVTVLTVNRADSVTLLLLGVIGVYAFLRFGVRGLNLNRQELLLMAVFAGWYAVIVLCYFTGDKTLDGFRLLGRYLRLLFFIPAFIACRRYLKHEWLLFIGILIAPFPTLGLGLWEWFRTSGNIRVGGVVEIIPFGDISLAMGFMALAILHFLGRYRAKVILYACCFGLIAGILSSGLSGTRGGWIALPIFIILTTVSFIESRIKKILKVFASICVIVMIAGFLSPKKLIENRIKESISSIEKYHEFLNLVSIGDIDQIGCLNEKTFMKMLALEIRKISTSSIDVSLITHGEKLNQVPHGLSCLFNNALIVKNLNKKDDAMFYVKRSVAQSTGTQIVNFLAKGNSKISINGSSNDWQVIKSDKYAYYTHIQKLRNSGEMMMYFWLPAGGWLQFVLIQNQIGEYVFPFANNSVGERLEMWRAAWHIFKQHPLLGAGTGSFRKELDKRVRAGDISPQVLSYDHPHNDYLNALCSWGLLGLLLYLFVMGYPLKIFIDTLRFQDKPAKAAGFAGVIMVSGLLVFGLTETMFTHSIVMSWYVTFTAMLMAVIFRNKPTDTHNAPV